MKAKKEISIAIFIGLIIALLVTGGVLRARRAIEQFSPPPILSRYSSPSPTTLPTSLFLELTSLDNAVVSEGRYTLSGKTLPGTYIAILGEKGEYLIIPNDLGTFSQEITLVKGANTIKVTVYTAVGDRIEKTVNAVYTTAEI